MDAADEVFQILEMPRYSPGAITTLLASLWV